MRRGLARAELTPTEAVGVACAFAEELELARAIGVVHRDVEPCNVFFTEPDGGGTPSSRCSTSG